MKDRHEVTLRHGALEFTAYSQGIGPLVLCLHGFPDNANSFREQLPVIAAAGYRVVTVTMRGYEPSSQPLDYDYSLPSIAQDVMAFIDQLGEQQAHLLGHDWGAAVAYTAGATAPEKFKSLIAISVPHCGRFLNEIIKYPKQLRLSWYMLFFQLPGIAEYAFARNDYQLLRRLWRNWSPSYTPPEEVLANIVQDFKQEGVCKAALSYYRTTLTLKAFTRSARADARFKVQVPTLAITGTEDGCIDSDVFQKMSLEEDFPAGLTVEQIAGAGHFPHQERAAMVNKLILSWLNRNEA